jgi:hypothetical protein
MADMDRRLATVVAARRRRVVVVEVNMIGTVSSVFLDFSGWKM